MSTTLYKDGDRMGIRTSCTSLSQFHDEFVRALDRLIESDWADGDWEFQLHAWLPQYVDLCIALGHKPNALRRVHWQSGDVAAENLVARVEGDLVEWPVARPQKKQEEP